MAFKINISEKGKTYKTEIESEVLVGKKIGKSFSGREISPDLQDYEFKITGTSDKSGFAGKNDEEGTALRKILLTKGKFMKKTPHKGFRRKKTVRGNTISADTVQINTVVIKEGGKKLEDIFGKKEVVEEKK